MDVVTSAQMKQIEENSLRYDLTFHRLMENAGSAAAAFIRRTFPVEGRNCMIFCAKGNNGGDGLVVARKLAESGANVVAVLLDGIPESEAAAAMYGTASLMDLPILDFTGDQVKIYRFLEQTDIIVDAICGTGFKGRLRDLHREACVAINNAIAAVVSLDIPTGVECDTGVADPDAVRADFTVVFDTRKPVHVKPESVAFCGVVEVVDIGIPEKAREGVVSVQPIQPPQDSFVFQEVDTLPEPKEQDSGEIPSTFTFKIEEAAPAPAPTAGPPRQAAPQIQPSPPVQKSKEQPVFPATSNQRKPDVDMAQVMALLPPRSPDSHKGSHGRLLIIAGCSRYRGAAVLAVLGALRSGCGQVLLASTEKVCEVAVSAQPETMLLPLPGAAGGEIDADTAISLLTPELSKATAVVFGCGLGDNRHTLALLEHVLLTARCPVLVDADGINVLAKHIHLMESAACPLLLTPHPGEMGRLTGATAEEVNLDRKGFALRFSAGYKSTLVLKGAGTLIAAPGFDLVENPTGNPGLAKGGSGDVLAGIIGSFLAQGILLRNAAVCGVFLHGLAADRAAARLGQYAMQPSDILTDLAAIFLEQGR